MNKTILIALVVMVSFSCKKENECCADIPQINTLSVTESFLVGPLWMLAGGGTTVNGEETAWCDVLPECLKDNLINFESDGEIITTEGLIYCNPNDPEIIETGTWELAPSGNQLLLADFSFNIIEINHATLKLTLSIENGPETIFNTYTYMAQ